MKPCEMNEVMAKFKARHPNVSGLNIRQMQGILAGDLVMVKMASTKKFLLMTPSDLEAGGKLDKMNADIAKINSETRARNRAAQAAYRAAAGRASMSATPYLDKLYNALVKGK